MKLEKMKRTLSVFVLISICMLTGCTGNAAAGIQDSAMLSVVSDVGTENAEDSSVAEMPGGNVDYSVYEAYGLTYDEKGNCYSYNGSIVRFFNDPAAGASFTNFFTGTVDIEAKRDADNNLIGIEECSQEVYDCHTQKHERFQSIQGNLSSGTGTDAVLEAGTGQSNEECLKGYADYGVSYNSQDGRWYYDGDKIRMLVDNERAFVYYTDEKGVCFVVSREGNHNITEIKTVSESDAGLLLQANKPAISDDFTTEEN